MLRLQGHLGENAGPRLPLHLSDLSHRDPTTNQDSARPDAPSALPAPAVTATQQNPYSKSLHLSFPPGRLQCQLPPPNVHSGHISNPDCGGLSTLGLPTCCNEVHRAKSLVLRVSWQSHLCSGLRTERTMATFLKQSSWGWRKQLYTDSWTPELRAGEMCSPTDRRPGQGSLLVSLKGSDRAASIQEGTEQQKEKGLNQNRKSYVHMRQSESQKNKTQCQQLTL